MNFAQPLSDDTLVRAAVRVVLPWSMWPMVPTLTCGLLRSNFSLAMSSTPSSLSAFTFAGRATVNNLRCRGLPTDARCVLASEGGADVQDRTGDLVLTKDALCQLSYIGLRPAGFGRQVGLITIPSVRRSAAFSRSPSVRPSAAFSR